MFWDEGFFIFRKSNERRSKMKKQLQEIQEKALAALNQVKQTKELDDIKVKFLGKKGELTAILKGMKDLTNEERPIIGQLANDVRNDIENKIEQVKKELAAIELKNRLESEKIDVTMPGHTCACGHKHPLDKVIDEISDIFIGMGYEIADGPEVEKDYYNFEALNIPPRTV
jgi:phenylalanyl-tRNA synthetase alpha chain